MHELEKHCRITYDSWEGHYEVHTARGTVKFHKDKQGLPYIDLDGSAQESAMMLMQLGMGKHIMMMETGMSEEHTMLMETVQGNYEGFTKNEIIRAKQARRAQAMMGNPSKKDYKGVVSNHLISNCPITTADITNS
jgi:hypothetical protein